MPRGLSVKMLRFRKRNTRPTLEWHLETLRKRVRPQSSPTPPGFHNQATKPSKPAAKPTATATASFPTTPHGYTVRVNVGKAFAFTPQQQHPSLSLCACPLFSLVCLSACLSFSLSRPSIPGAGPSKRRPSRRAPSSRTSSLVAAPPGTPSLPSLSAPCTCCRRTRRPPCSGGSTPERSPAPGRSMDGWEADVVKRKSTCLFDAGTCAIVFDIFATNWRQQETRGRWAGRSRRCTFFKGGTRSGVKDWDGPRNPKKKRRRNYAHAHRHHTTAVPFFHTH